MKTSHECVHEGNRQLKHNGTRYLVGHIYYYLRQWPEVTIVHCTLKLHFDLTCEEKQWHHVDLLEILVVSCKICVTLIFL